MNTYTPSGRTGALFWPLAAAFAVGAWYVGLLLGTTYAFAGLGWKAHLIYYGVAFGLLALASWLTARLGTCRSQGKCMVVTIGCAAIAWGSVHWHAYSWADREQARALTADVRAQIAALQAKLAEIRGDQARTDELQARNAEVKAFLARLKALPEAAALVPHAKKLLDPDVMNGAVNALVAKSSQDLAAAGQAQSRLEKSKAAVDQFELDERHFQLGIHLERLAARWSWFNPGTAMTLVILLALLELVAFVVACAGPPTSVVDLPYCETCRRRCSSSDVYSRRDLDDHAVERLRTSVSATALVAEPSSRSPRAGLVVHYRVHRCSDLCTASRYLTIATGDGTVASSPKPIVEYAELGHGDLEALVRHAASWRGDRGEPAVAP